MVTLSSANKTEKDVFLSCPEHGTKKKFWVLLCCTAEQGLSLISYAKHDTNDIDDSNSIQEVCYYMSFMMGLANHRASVAQW